MWDTSNVDTSPVATFIFKYRTRSACHFYYSRRRLLTRPRCSSTHRCSPSLTNSCSFGGKRSRHVDSRRGGGTSPSAAGITSDLSWPPTKLLTVIRRHNEKLKRSGSRRRRRKKPFDSWRRSSGDQRLRMTRICVSLPLRARNDDLN